MNHKLNTIVELMLNRCESNNITYKVDYTMLENRILENTDIYTLNIYTKDGTDSSNIFENSPHLSIVFSFSNLSYISLSHFSNWDGETVKINYDSKDMIEYKKRIVNLYETSIDKYMDTISEEIFNDFDISPEEVRDFKISKIIE